MNQALRKQSCFSKLKRGDVSSEQCTTPHSKEHDKKIQELGWNKTLYPSYSPDLAPSDYHLFCSLENHLKEMAFVMQKDVKTVICEFFESIAK